MKNAVEWKYFWKIYSISRVVWPLQIVPYPYRNPIFLFSRPNTDLTIHLIFFEKNSFRHRIVCSFTLYVLLWAFLQKPMKQKSKTRFLTISQNSNSHQIINKSPFETVQKLKDRHLKGLLFSYQPFLFQRFLKIICFMKGKKVFRPLLTKHCEISKTEGRFVISIKNYTIPVIFSRIDQIVFNRRNLGRNANPSSTLTKSRS